MPPLDPPAAAVPAAPPVRVITGPEANRIAHASEMARARPVTGGGDEGEQEQRDEPIEAWLAHPFTRMTYFPRSGRLVLTFEKKRTVYAYSAVPEHVALQLRANAGAPGHFYVTFIKGNYPSARLA